MAHWFLEKDLHDAVIRLFHIAYPGEKDVLVEPCGKVPFPEESNLEAWVVDNMQPFDVISTSRGSFVRVLFPENERV